jgi:hypothetical protein
MAVTYTPIANTTLTSAAASYTFSSIPSTYTDLVLVFSGTAVSSDTMYYQFNNDTTALYSDTYMFGDGTAGSGRHANYGYILAGGINTTQSHQVINIMNYANTTTNKTTLLRGNASGVAATVAFVGMWRSTAAITSIKLSIAATFATGSTFTLYGIKAA